MRSRSKKLEKTETPETVENAVDRGELPEPSAPEPVGFRSFASLPASMKQAGTVLDRVRAVPSCFIDFDRANRIGGVPLRRILTVHGPTHGGKTAFIAGLLRSFTDAGHVGDYVDAEHATDLTFFDELFERRVSSIPNFFAKRPTTYEEVVDSFDEFLSWMRAERAKRAEHWREKTKTKKGAVAPPLPPDLDLAALSVVDSINKLVPEREIEKLRKEGADALDKGWGRLRAAYNQAFLDHVVPLLGPAETTLCLIVQEREDEDLQPWEMPKLKGGKATQYDASLIVRIMKSTEVAEGEGKDKRVFGFKHRIRIWKSKVGHMDGRHTDAFFHMSNGELVPAGFDFARDALVVGKEVGVVEVSGSWYSWRKKRWNGLNTAVVALTKDRASLAALQQDIRATFPKPEIE